VTTPLADAMLETLNTAAAVGSFIVFFATAVAALIQIRHLRASNELEAFITLTEQLRAGHVQRALRYVQTELSAALEDPAYRSELAHRGFIDPEKHPEMDACNWFNEVGTLVKNRLIDEATFLDLFSRLVAYYWSRMEPAIAVMRRERGPSHYENFEYLAILARRWEAEHPGGAFPKKVARVPLVDPWHELDGGR
jgi:hypothetical protein